MVHRDGNGTICRIEYSPDTVQMGACIFAYLLQVLLFPILFFLLLVFVLQRYPEAMKTDLALSLSLTLLGVVALALSIASVFRAARCIKWFRDKSQFIFEKNMLIVEGKSAKPTKYYWSDLKRITDQNKHLIFNSGHRVIVPAEFWNVYYNNRYFKNLLGDSLFSNVRTPRSPTRKVGTESGSSTKIRGKTNFTVHYDSYGKVCGVEYLPNPVRMGLFAFSWIFVTCFSLLVSMSPIIIFFMNLIQGKQNPFGLETTILSGLLSITLLALAIPLTKAYFVLFWFKPRYLFEPNGLKCIDEKGNETQYLWKDLTRVTLIGSHFVFKSRRRVFFSEEFWKVYYNREDFTELLGDTLLSKSGIKICGKIIRIPMWYGP